MRISVAGGIRVQYLDADGPLLSSPADAAEVIQNAWSERIDLIAIPVGRVDPHFFQLASLLSGQISWTLADYRLRLAVVGDLSEQPVENDALREFVGKSNRGECIWFVPNENALDIKLRTQLENQVDVRLETHRTSHHTM